MRAIAEIGRFAASTQRFSLRDAARILEVPEARLRALARAGFLAPQRGPIGPLSFGFQDLLLLRTTKGLLESGVSMRRIRRIWASLREQLAAEMPLTSISISTDGEEVVASDGSTRWGADSGQFLLNFEASELAARADQSMGFGRLGVVTGTAPAADQPPPELPREDRLRVVGREVSPPRGASPRGDGHSIQLGGLSVDIGEDASLSAEEWYETACELEATSPDQAVEAYDKALELEPDMAAAHVNLGRLFHIAGERGRAEPHYREAVKLDPDDPTPHFNLGVMLEELGRREEAVHAYRQAILRDPDFADAHCNLGLLLEAFGRDQEAMRHLMAARKLSGSSDE